MESNYNYFKMKAKPCDEIMGVRINEDNQGSTKLVCTGPETDHSEPICLSPKKEESVFQTVNPLIELNLRTGGKTKTGNTIQHGPNQSTLEEINVSSKPLKRKLDDDQKISNTPLENESAHAGLKGPMDVALGGNGDDQKISAVPPNIQKRVRTIVNMSNAGTLVGPVDAILDPKEIDQDDISNEDTFKVKDNSQVLARGSFGEVLRMTGKNGHSFIVKGLNRGVNVNPSEILTPYVRKAKGIIRMFAIKFYEKRLWIVMEDAGRSLKWWLSNRDNDRFKCWVRKLENLIGFSLKLFSVVKYLEQQGIVHRDIKTENICLMWKDEDFVATLIDFGSVQNSQDALLIDGHTPEFLPPVLVKLISLQRKNPLTCSLESIQRIFFDEKCDAWAMGIVILTVFKGGFHPIPGVNAYNTEHFNWQRTEVEKEIIDMKDGYFEIILKDVLEPLQEAVRNVLRVNRDRRWSAKQFCAHMEGDGQRVNAKFQRNDAIEHDITMLKPSPLARTTGVKQHVVGMNTPPCSNPTQETNGNRDLAMFGVRAKAKEPLPLVVGINARPTKTPASTSAAPADFSVHGGFKVVGIGYTKSQQQTLTQGFFRQGNYYKPVNNNNGRCFRYPATANAGFAAPGNAGFAATGNVGFGAPGNAGFGAPGNAGFGAPGNAGFAAPGNAGFAATANVGFCATGNAGFGAPGNAGFAATANVGFGAPGNAGFDATAVVGAQPINDDNESTFICHHGGGGSSVGNRPTTNAPGDDAVEASGSGFLPAFDLILDEDDHGKQKKCLRKTKTGRRRTSNDKQ